MEPLRRGRGEEPVLNDEALSLARDPDRGTVGRRPVQHRLVAEERAHQHPGGVRPLGRVRRRQLDLEERARGHRLNCVTASASPHANQSVRLPFRSKLERDRQGEDEQAPGSDDLPAEGSVARGVPEREPDAGEQADERREPRQAELARDLEHQVVRPLVTRQRLVTARSGAQGIAGEDVDGGVRHGRAVGAARVEPAAATDVPDRDEIAILDRRTARRPRRRHERCQDTD